MTAFKKVVPEQDIQFDWEQAKIHGNFAWVVNVAVYYYHGPRKDNYWINIPSNFVTHGASVPRFMRRWLHPRKRGGQAAVLHDYMCRQQTARVAKTRVEITRRQANRIFLEAMKVAEVPWYKRCAMFVAASLYHPHAEAPAEVPGVF